MSGADLLAQIPLFAGLSSGERAALSDALRKRRYARGEVIFHQDDPGASLYILAEGQVKIVLTSSEGKQKTLALLGPGDFFGELSLLDEEPRSADAVAVEECHLLILGREQFLPFLKAHPEAALKLLAALCHRLRRTDQLVQDAAFLDVPGRLAKAVLELAETQGKREATGIVITPRLNQGDLATLVGATRESVNKWLGFYEQRGLLRYERGKITVLRPEELRRRVY